MSGVILARNIFIVEYRVLPKGLALKAEQSPSISFYK
jgi:hypothetical protein